MLSITAARLQYIASAMSNVVG